MTRRLSALALAVALAVVAAAAWAYWSAGSVPGGNGAAAASSINQGATPSASAVGSTVTVSWAASTLAGGQPVSGYRITRYDVTGSTAQTVLSACAGTVTATSCVESGVPNGSWRYSVTPVFAADWRGPESAKSATVTVSADVTPPTNAISLSSVTGGAFLSGTTVHYRGADPGSLRLTNAVADTGSGPASSTSAPLGGTATGWTHPPSTVSTPSGGPFVSAPFSWATGTSSSPTETVTGRDAAGNTATTQLTFVTDASLPTGTISHQDGFTPNRSITVTFSSADTGSGLQAVRLQRAQATLGVAGCGAFGSFANLGAANPTSPYTDQGKAGACYKYRLVLTDRVGNQAVVVSTSVTKVGYAGAVQATSGLVSYWRLGEATGAAQAVDSRGPNHAAYSGTVLGQPGALAGDTDTAMRFDGSDYVQDTTPVGLPTGSSPRTVEMWFNTTSSTQQVLFDYGSQGNNQQFGLWLDAGGSSITAWGYGSGNDKTFPLGGAKNNGLWHQVVITYDSTNLRLYLDGALVGAQAATRTTAVNGTGFSIGRVTQTGDSNSGFSFNGLLDEVSLYDVALSATTIADHYALAGPAEDLGGPTGGSVDATGLVGTGTRWSTATTLTLALATGTDPSGVATAGHELKRASGALTGGACGAYGSYATTATDPSATTTDTVPATDACYRYQYVVADTLGNLTTYTSPDIKVDTTPPSVPAVPTYSAASAATGTGSTVFYRRAAATGSITLTTSATDPASGIVSTSFPSPGAGWTVTPGATGVATYSWSAAGTATAGTSAVTATNAATLTSGPRAVTFTADDAAPTGGSISYADGRTTSATAALTLGTATDGAGSGLAGSVVQQAAAPVTGGACGAFGPFATLGEATGPTYTAALAVDTCYRFQLVANDKVGNTATWTSPSVVRRAAGYASVVAGTTGLLDWWRLGEASGPTAVDANGANNNGTYTGGPTLGVAGALVDDTSTATQFNGSTQYVQASRGVSGDFSVELWFRSTQGNGGTGAAWSSGAALLDATASGSAYDFGISLQSDGRVAAGTDDAVLGDTTIKSPAGYHDGQWHHVVFTRSQAFPFAALVLFVDGVQVGTGSGSTVAPTGSAVLNLARSTAGNRYFAGSLDEVATYASVLTPAQVAAHFNAGR